MFSELTEMIYFPRSLIRLIFLDLSLACILVVYASLEWMDHLHHAYLVPQLSALEWKPDRSVKDMTYYARTCDAADLTTRSVTDLFLSTDATAQDAADHNLKHGFTIIRNVLSSKTMADLRNYINWKNHADESLFVIESDHRFNILFGTEEPAVRHALEEIANHKQFRRSLEAIVGPNPAMIEMTAITSTAGAVAQYWHPDVDLGASATNYARSYGPLYSVFVQLQNTTVAMGATSICPGSHYCTGGSIAAYCEAAGIHAVNEHGYTGGDALIMNMNSFHRGAAHTDYEAPDRIMLILTFSHKPKQRAETRTMSQGITFQLRWDMWGHTLNDIAAANTVLRYPWVILKSLGLYKPPSSDWGVDYIWASSQRIVNRDNGFQRHNLDRFLQQGGFRFLPIFLQGNVSDDESWYEFLSRTLYLCRGYMKISAIVGVGSYVMFSLDLVIVTKGEMRSGHLRKSSWRLLSMGFTVLLSMCLQKLDSTDLVGQKDILANRLFTSVVEYDRFYADKSRHYHTMLSFTNPCGPTTYPNRHDVLIETRYGSTTLVLFNSFVDGHPGNKAFQNLVDIHAGNGYNTHSALFKDATARYLRKTIAGGQGRFLYQLPDGVWVRLNAAEADAYISQQLWLRANKFAEKTSVWIRHGLSELRYGIYRNTTLVLDHSRLFATDMKRKFSSVATEKDADSVHKGRSYAASTLHSKFSLPTLPSGRRMSLQLCQRSRFENFSPEPTEPFPEAWIEEGDLVEVLLEEEAAWYGASIRRAYADGSFDIQLGDDTSVRVDVYQIRRVQQTKPGEIIEILVDDGSYQNFEIVDQAPDGTLQAIHLITRDIVQGVTSLQLRRRDGEAKRRLDMYATYADIGVDVGDLVEVLYTEELWYTGRITDISTTGELSVEYAVGTEATAELESVRIISEYKIGEILEVFMQDGEFYSYQQCEFLAKLEKIHSKQRIWRLGK